jgi:hypothetical protein
MNIKHGDVITLENGDVVKVSLEVIQQKITELVPGKYYRIRHSGQFCHWYDSDGYVSSNDLVGQTFQFIGNVDSDKGPRAIFYGVDRSSYLMMGCKVLDYVIAEVKV